MDIAKYFEHGQTSSRMPNNLTLVDNNTTLCQTSSADKLPIPNQTQCWYIYQTTDVRACTQPCIDNGKTEARSCDPG